MRIGIDARTILNPEKGEDIGVGHYTYQLIRNLLSVDTINEYVLFFDYRVREKDVAKFTQPNVKIKFYPFSDYKKYLPGAYSEILGQATLAREDLDVLHSTSPVSRIPYGYEGACVCTINNLGVFQEPTAYPRLRAAKERAQIKYMAKKGDVIIAVSESIAQDLVKLFGVSRDKIQVIHSGLDTRFFDAPKTDGSKVREQFGITKPYMLFMGTLSPINNIVRLLEAFAHMKKHVTEAAGNQKEFPYQLVLAGKRGWLSQEYHQTVKDLGLSKDVIFTGYIVGEDLVPLFKGAELFVMPSLYEGFGTTVLEAFATETPVIASRVSSLPEIAGDAARFINPMDVEGMATAMLELASDEAQQEQLRQKGTRQAQLYSWERVAKETLDVYRHAAAKKK